MCDRTEDLSGRLKMKGAILHVIVHYLEMILKLTVLLHNQGSNLSKTKQLIVNSFKFIWHAFYNYLMT